MKEAIYISGPYSHPDKEVRDERGRQLTIAASTFVRYRHIVYSPITHTAPMERLGLNLTHEAWLEFDRWFMERCTRCVVVALDGWFESLGVKEEIKYFNEAYKLVLYVTPEEIEDYAKGWAE